VVRQQLRDTPGVVELAGALAPLSLEQGFPYWLAMATVFEGWALSESGEADLAITHITRGVSAFRATSAVLWLPYFLSLLAEAHVRVGKLAQVRSLFDDALARVTRTDERWFEAELHRGRGEVLLRLPECGTAEAEACFRKALAIAQEQEAKLWELRAATSLARLWAEQGKRAQARDLLAPVYGWFTEGFDTADLKDARALLDDLR
jgi:predicted ATPase